MMRKAVKTFAPPPKMTVAQWAERYRYLSAETSALPGKYSLEITPYLRGILECITDRGIRKIVCQKSAQVGWTDGVINNYIGYSIHVDPGPTGVMFPRDQNAKDYDAEKFIPMVEATPILSSIVNVKTRSKDNTQNRKKFPGGFLKLFGSNSTGGVKSTPFKKIIVEEPDDCNLNIKGQGDSIKLAEERVKTFRDHKILAGGTPSIMGVSSIAAEMELSDKRYFYVACHECGDSHVLEWANVRVTHDESQVHPVYGSAQIDTTRYICPQCGAVWNDAQKNRSVRKGEWKASAPFRGIAGFYINELYSSFPESKLARLMEKYLNAEYELNNGEPGAMIAFWNSSLGLAYEYQTNTPDEDALKARAEDYSEMTIPWGGLLLTAGVDVQHDRLAIIIRAWGRGEENWLIYWGEIQGVTVVAGAGAWVDLDALLTKEFRHVSGAKMGIKAVSIDSSDGTTSDAVYSFVRDRRGRGYMAIKGASEAGDSKREIFAKPGQAVDVDRKNKAYKYGVQPYIVGTNRAKDLVIEGRLPLLGTGPGRMHWYKTVRPDYWEQLTSEIKAPHRTVKNKKVWQKKSGVRNEALDCEVYAFHAARSLKINLLKEYQWTELDNRIRQKQIFDNEEEAQATDDAEQDTEQDGEAVEPTDAVAIKPPVQTYAQGKPTKKKTQQRNGFSVKTW
jgi:phage terminase large subunit GpA-like protein